MITTSNEEPKLPWTKPNAKVAFTKALTEASRSATFRQRLMASCDSAKTAVADLGNIDIPKEAFILFFEPKDAQPPASALASASAPGRDNENYHIFVLPPLQAGGSETYLYEDYLRCCYPVWRD